MLPILLYQDWRCFRFYPYDSLSSVSWSFVLSWTNVEGCCWASVIKLLKDRTAATAVVWFLFFLLITTIHLVPGSCSVCCIVLVPEALQICSRLLWYIYSSSTALWLCSSLSPAALQLWSSALLQTIRMNIFRFVPEYSIILLSFFALVCAAGWSKQHYVPTYKQ